MGTTGADQAIFRTEMNVTRQRLFIERLRLSGADTAADERVLACLLDVLVVHRRYRKRLSRQLALKESQAL